MCLKSTPVGFFVVPFGRRGWWRGNFVYVYSVDYGKVIACVDIRERSRRPPLLCVGSPELRSVISGNSSSV